MTSAPAPRREAAFIFILITVALDMLALGVVIPVLPKLIAQFEGGDLKSAARIVGLFGFAWAAMQFFFQPVLGALSDHYGRRPVVLASNLGLGLDYVFMALAPSLPFLFVGRLISGATAASVATANAYISDITPPEKRAGRFGLIGAAFGLGFILGPAIGGALGEYDLRFPFWAAAFFSLANFAYGWFILPESLAPEKRTEKVVWRSANVLGSFEFLRSQKTLSLFAAALFLSYLAHESLPALFVLYTQSRYNWDPSTTGWALAIVGISQTVVSGGLVRPAVARLGEKTTLTIALVSGALGLIAYAFAPTGAIFMAAPPLIALWGMANPSFQGLATRLAGQSEQGRLQGALGSLRGVSGMIGPLFFSQIFAASLSFDLFIGAGYFVAGLLLATSLFIGLKAISRGAN
ncbi:TCR/Tet family MFS transporter [Methylocystis parvus]|uniref:TCR/Tet family MFS transporter n=1 Tax=Methylocystis parvus TaxID=134 RepID=UPI003C721AFF